MIGWDLRGPRGTYSEEGGGGRFVNGKDHPTLYLRFPSQLFVILLNKVLCIWVDFLCQCMCVSAIKMKELHQ